MSTLGPWQVVQNRGNTGRGGPLVSLRCWVDESGDNCGNSAKSDSVVEIGPVRGDESRAWFASDLEAVSKKSGCTPLSECGNPDPYSFAWTVQGEDLQFSDLVGFGANEGDTYEPWTFKPWTRIA